MTPKPPAEADAKATTPTIVGVDNGANYNVAFKKKHKQWVRIIGKGFAPETTVRLMSKKVRWGKYKHPGVSPMPGEWFGLPGLEVILVRDSPQDPPKSANPLAKAEAEDPKDRDDSGDLTVSVSNEGAPSAIKDNEVLYP